VSVPAALRRTYPDEIVERLRSQILSGELTAGECLPPERELALALGTNRNTLREAIRSLEAQGLVHARQGDGVRVVDFRAAGELPLLAHYFRFATPAEQARLLADLLRLRRLIAAEAVQRAAEVADPAGVAGVEEQLARLRRAAQVGAGATLLEPELGLYRSIIAAGQSLAAMWLFNTFERVIRGFTEAYPGLWITAPKYLERWEAVADGIRRKNPRAAGRALAALLKDTDRLLLDLMGAPARAPRRRWNKS